MCRNYRKPILLIEFDNSRAFAMNSASDITSEISNSSIISKISLLCIHFPALRVLWSRDPDMTADMFYALKQLFDEPDEATAVAVGAQYKLSAVRLFL
jgi:DNA excision repair protein ERCC-4